MVPAGVEDVVRVGWDDRRCVLALTGAGPGGMWRKELALDRHSALVELARERVSATLIASTAVRHGDRVCAVVMARRQPGSGKVIWVTLLNQAGDTGGSGGPGQVRSGHRRSPGPGRYSRQVAARQ
jgi:hypothetical protein